ncbi:MAG: helix-turn-helix domain-containing protein [Pedobacter sp.]
MTLAERLKKVREETGLSQKNMAKSLSIATRTWQIYEEGGSVPGGNVLEGLGRLGFNINWVLLEDGEMMRCKEEYVSTFPIDKKIMWEVIVEIEKVFARLSKPWPPEKKAELILLLHDEIMEGEMKSEEIEKNVLRIVKLAS